MKVDEHFEEQQLLLFPLRQAEAFLFFVLNPSSKLQKTSQAQ